MELSEIWSWYCEEHFSDVANFDKLEIITPMRGIELLFDLHPMFTARFEIIQTVAYDTAFDKIADGALAYTARYNNFDMWEDLPAGGWRVLLERLQYVEVVFSANAAQGNEVIASLPSDLPKDAQTKAVMLNYLLNGGRTIDRRLLPKKPDGALQPFPAQSPIQKH